MKQSPPMFRSHDGFQITQLSPQRPKGYKRQRIGRARRKAVPVILSHSNVEAILWLQRR